jgi:two-component system CheB/CheR fusion protein
LVSALEEFAASTSSLFQIKCIFSCSGTIPELNNTLAMHVYYIAQEAVINAVKHGRSSQVTVNLKQIDNGILLTVQDDGIGFRPTDRERVGMGIGIMRYRAKVIGATLELRSELGQGTLIVCKFPPTIG